MSVIVMGKFPFRLIAAIALFLMIFALRMFTNLDNNVIVSIFLISIFLIIFTYVFKIEGPSLLKTFVILFSFNPIFIYCPSSVRFILSGILEFIFKSSCCYHINSVCHTFRFAGDSYND